MTTPETFDQFYARIAATRKAEIAACTDPVKRAELEAWDATFEAQWKAAWQINEARKASSQSELTDEELQERRRQYLDENPEPRGRGDYEEHCPHQVVNGRAW